MIVLLVNHTFCVSFHLYQTDEDNINYSPDKDHLGSTYSGTATHAQLEHQASTVKRAEVENRLHQLEGMVSTLYDLMWLCFVLFE